MNSRPPSRRILSLRGRFERLINARSMFLRIVLGDHAGTFEIAAHADRVAVAIVADRLRRERVEGKDSIRAADVAVPVAAGIEIGDRLTRRIVAAGAADAIDRDESGIVI